MTLWRLSDDANGSTLCDECDAAGRPFYPPEALADWLANRIPVHGHCAGCGIADHATDEDRRACLACRWDLCDTCGHWADDHVMRAMDGCAGCAICGPVN